MKLEDREVILKSDALKGKKIDLIVCGGIAAIETPRIIRELRRHGAEVRALMTNAAEIFITPIALEWAANQAVVTQLSGRAEHLSDADAVLVAPATLDFISKMSLGLADSPALTAVQSRLGRVPVLILPTMNGALWENPILQENLRSLSKRQGVEILNSREEEEKMKIPAPEILVESVIRSLSHSSLRGKKVLLSLGSTRSFIDRVRYLTNISTGETGLAIAQEFFRRGAHLQLVGESVVAAIPSYLSIYRASDQKALADFMIKDQSEIVIHSAAVLDFSSANFLEDKKSSEQAWNIKLVPTNKIIDRLGSNKRTVIGFKLETGLNEKELHAKIRRWNKEKKCRLVVGNLVEEVHPDQHITHIYNAKTDAFQKAYSKQELAQNLADQVELILDQKRKSKSPPKP